MSTKLKVKKGDEVVVIAGKDKGKKGKVIKVFPATNKALVAGVNTVKKHQKPGQQGDGGIIKKEMPINCSNILHVDPKTKEPARVGYKFLKDGKKVRFSKKSGEIID